MPFFVSKRELHLLERAAADADKLREALAVAIAEKRALEERLNVMVGQNRVLQVNLEWARTQINTLNVERAQILQRGFHLELLVPEVVSTPTGQPPVVDTAEEERQERITGALAAQFEDMGDEAAAAVGVEHGPAGELLYRR